MFGRRDEPAGRAAQKSRPPRLAPRWVRMTPMTGDGRSRRTGQSGLPRDPQWAHLAWRQWRVVIQEHRAHQRTDSTERRSRGRTTAPRSDQDQPSPCCDGFRCEPGSRGLGDSFQERNLSGLRTTQTCVTWWSAVSRLMTAAT